jgi:hypothetical protein
MALGAVADDRYGLAREFFEVGIVVVEHDVSLASGALRR